MAKLNLEFYKEDFNIDFGINKEENNDIINYIYKYKEYEYEKIFENDLRIPIFVNLSSIRNNIINWYDFDQNSNVLEIGAGYGSVTGELCKKNKNVTSLEFIKAKAEAILKRHEDKENLEVICGNLKDIKFEKKFDYITLFDILEYSNLLFGGVNELLKYLKTLLNENGTILIAVNNKFGSKYFTGAINRSNDPPYSKLLGDFSDGYEMFTKNELENYLKKAEFNNYKFYYPLPDYKLTNVIYSDKYLPNKEDSKIHYNIYYNEFDNILFSELGLIKQFINNNRFTEFCNSYFIEVGNSNNEKNFISFNNMRKNKYRLKTYLTDKEAKKEPMDVESLEHIDTINKNLIELKKLGFNVIDYKEGNVIKSKLVNLKTFDYYLVNLIENETKERFLDEIEKLYKYIKSKFVKIKTKDDIFTKYNIVVEDSLKDRMYIVKDGYLDLIFQNIFFDGEYIIFDQEWYEENIPLELILYRAIFNMFFYNKHIEKYITKNEVYKYFGIIDYIGVFEELEGKWQRDIVDINVLRFYSNTYSKIKAIDELKLENTKTIKEKEELIENKNKTIQEKEIELENKDKILQEKENELKEKENELKEKTQEIQNLNIKLANIVNSRSWRYTKIFRKD